MIRKSYLILTVICVVFIIGGCSDMGIKAPTGPWVDPDTAADVISNTDAALTLIIEELSSRLDNSNRIYSDQEVDYNLQTCTASKAVTLSGTLDSYEILFNFFDVALSNAQYGFVSGSLEIKEECLAVDNYLILSLEYISGSDVLDVLIQSGNDPEKIIIEVNGHDMKDSLKDMAIQIITDYKQLIKNYLL